MEAKASATRTPVAIVKFNGAKTVNAVPMTDAQTALYELGEQLGYAIVDNIMRFRDALKSCKTHDDRMILRAGFVSSYRASRGATESAAIQSFNRYAAECAPKTSRKAKSNAKKDGKKGGRPEKKDGKGEHVPAQDVALRLAAVLHYVAEAQAKYAGDGDMLEVLGEIAAIAGGKTK